MRPPSSNRYLRILGLYCWRPIASFWFIEYFVAGRIILTFSLPRRDELTSERGTG